MYLRLRMQNGVVLNTYQDIAGCSLFSENQIQICSVWSRKDLSNFFLRPWSAATRSCATKRNSAMGVGGIRSSIHCWSSPEQRIFSSWEGTWFFHIRSIKKHVFFICKDMQSSISSGVMEAKKQIGSDRHLLSMEPLQLHGLPTLPWVDWMNKSCNQSDCKKVSESNKPASWMMQELKHKIKLSWLGIAG